MNVSGQTLRFLSIAALWLAVLFVPSIASAHDGHAPGHTQSVVHIVHHATSSHASSVKAVAQHTVSDRASAEETRFDGQSLSASRNSLAIAADPCGGVKGCCSDCVICCSIVFSSGSSDLTPVMRSIRVRMVSPAQVRGIEPQALRKPPRTLV